MRGVAGRGRHVADDVGSHLRLRGTEAGGGIEEANSRSAAALRCHRSVTEQETWSGNERYQEATSAQADMASDQGKYA